MIRIKNLTTRPAAILLLLSIPLLGSSACGPQSEPRSAKLKAGGIWHPEVRPTSVYHDGSVYFTWVDPEGRVGVSKIDNKTGAIQHNALGETHVNDHTVPSILIREPDHRIVLFWTRHGDSHVHWRISSKPGDITSFGDLNTFPAENVTYTQNVQLSEEDGRIYLFYRSRNRWLYRTSTDGAESFSDPTVLLENYSEIRPRIQVVSDNRKRIHFVDGAAYLGVWHFYYENGQFYQSDGTVIRAVSELPIESRDELTLVYDHTAEGHHDTRGCDLALDSAGNPYYTFTVRVDHHNDHRHWYARWKGDRWTSFEVARAGSSIKDGGFPMSGGICLDHDNPSIVYSSREVGDRVYQIFKYETTDGGATWIERARLEGMPNNKNFRPNYVRNATLAPTDERIEVLWNAGPIYDGRTNYQTDIWGYPIPFPVNTNEQEPD